MVVDVKLFTIEKLYHLDRLFCSRPKLVIHCYLLKPLLIDRAHSNDSNSGLIPIIKHSAVGKRRSPYRLLPPAHFSDPPSSIRRRRRRGRSNYSCHVALGLNNNGMMIATPANDKSSTSSSSAAATAAPYYYSQGLTTYAVPMSLHATNRSRLLSSMTLSTIIRPGRRAAAAAVGLILLEGGRQQTRYDTDTEPVFRQESYFHYLFGASSYEGCFGIITLPPDAGTEKSKTILFLPTYDIEVATVCGPCPNFHSVKEELGVDEVRDVNELSSFIDTEMEYHLIAHKDDDNDNASDTEEADNTTIAKLYLLKGLNTDSGKYAQPA